MAMLHTPGGDAFGLVEEQIGRSHWAAIAKEKEKLISGGLGVRFHPFISAFVSSLTCQKQGSEIPFPDPSFIPSKGALREGGRLYQPVGSEDWLSQKPPNYKAALVWVGRCSCCGCLHRGPGGLELHLQCLHLFPKVLPTSPHPQSLP